MSDEDDGDTRVGEALDDVEQIVGLLGREDRGGLVEDEDVGLAIEGLEDLDSLLRAHG